MDNESLPRSGHSPLLKWDSQIELTAAWDTGVNGVVSAQGIKTGLSLEYEVKFLQKMAHWLAVEEYMEGPDEQVGKRKLFLNAQLSKREKICVHIHSSLEEILTESY